MRFARRDEVQQVLSLILRTRDSIPDEATIVDFLRFSVERRMDLTRIWLAVNQADQPIWAILPLVNPGKTMLLFTPTVLPPEAERPRAWPRFRAGGAPARGTTAFG